MDDVGSRLRQAWASGDELLLSPGQPDECPGPEAVLPEIEAATIRELLTEPGGHPRGVRIRGARIVGDLDWSWQQLAVPLELRHCVLADDWNLRDATTPNLKLHSCHVGAINLSGATVTHDLRLTGGCTATGELRLVDASIGGVLSLSGATLVNRGGNAVNADRVAVNGGAYLREGFTSVGVVRLLGATIGGDLSLSAAALSNPGGIALNADRVTIRGGLYLRRGFTSAGAIRLLGATIGGDLSLSTATLSNPGGHALYADRATITGAVHLRAGFTATGTVRLVGASVGSDLDLNTATLANPSGHALDLEGARITGCLRLDAVSSPPDGAIGFTRTHVGELRDTPESWPAPGLLALTGFTYDRLGTHSTVDVAQRLDWLRRNERYSPQPYRQLARLLTETGHPDHAKRILIAARDDERRLGDLRWYARAASWLLSISIAHGYRPLRPAWLLIVCALFTWWIVAANAAVFVPTGDNVPEDPKTGKPTISAQRCTGNYPCLIPAAYAVESMTPILDLHQASLWQPTTATTRGKAVRGWLYATSAIGWIGSTLVVVALTGLADRRD